ncbi:MAG: hypothetical protein WAK12_05425 [Acidimicrobiales bacterium]
MWASHYDADDDWEIWFSRSDVSVRVAQPRLLLAMKLLAGRGQRDTMDIDLLLGEFEIESFDDAWQSSTSITRLRQLRRRRCAIFTSV